MSDEEEYDLLDYARAGEKEPFVELFAEPDGVKKFLEIRDEFTEATPFHMVAANGHADLLAYFISQITDAAALKRAVNAQNDSGNTPLHWAALTGSLDAVKLLHAAGADPLLKNKTGLDSCYQAESAGQEEIANFLCSVAGEDEAEDEAGGEDAADEADDAAAER